MGDDDSVREKAMEYVSVSLMDMRHKLFIPHEENEKFLVELIRKVRLYIITCSMLLLLHLMPICTCIIRYSLETTPYPACKMAVKREGPGISWQRSCSCPRFHGQ